MKVLLCAGRTPATDPASWRQLVGVQVEVVPELCRRPTQIGHQAAGAERLVVGVCPGEYSLGAIQAEARRAAVDALGVELVDLGAAAGDPGRLLVIVAGAVARARAFHGSRPDQAKLRLSLATSLTRRRLLSLALAEYVAAPAVEPARCWGDRGCRACVEACPRQALTWADGQVVVARASCEPCGLCATACPAEAIDHPTAAAAQVEAQLRALLDPAIGPPGRRGVVFTCQRATRPEIEAGWFPVVLPCVGMAPATWLLAPLLMGAGAVAARPCRDVGCPLGHDELTRERVAYCRSLLERLGADSAAERVVATAGALPEPLPAGPEPAGLLGPLAAAPVVRSLAGACSTAAAVRLKHDASPLGLVEIADEACSRCAICAESCPTGALVRTDEDETVAVSFDAARCVACGQCLPRCPETARSAIALSRVTDLEAIGRGAVIAFREPLLRCARCGGPLAPAGLMRRVGELLGEEQAGTTALVSRYCRECRGLPFTPSPSPASAVASGLRGDGPA